MHIGHVCDGKHCWLKITCWYTYVECLAYPVSTTETYIGLLRVVITYNKINTCGLPCIELAIGSWGMIFLTVNRLCGFRTCRILKLCLVQRPNLFTPFGSMWDLVVSENEHIHINSLIRFPWVCIWMSYLSRKWHIPRPAWNLNTNLVSSHSSNKDTLPSPYSRFDSN
jgi:hypothetical protein